MFHPSSRRVRLRRDPGDSGLHAALEPGLHALPRVVPGLVVTSATLVVTGALLVVTRSY